MKHLILFLVLATVVLSCKKKAENYPGFFDGVEATHEAMASCGTAQVYVKLNDNSVVFFGLKDEKLEINQEGTIVSLDDLIDWSGVYYYEWTNHPDSLAPQFCDDLAYINSSAIRKWSITNGEIRAAVSKIAVDREFMETYKISIQLKNAIFDRSESGEDAIIIDNMIIRDALVGWLPG